VVISQGLRIVKLGLFVEWCGFAHFGSGVHPMFDRLIQPLISIPKGLLRWPSVRFWVWVIAGGAAIATSLGFAGQLWWRLGFLDHPRPQYSLILLIGLLVGLISRQSWSSKRWHLLWSVPLLINLWLLLPLGVSPPLASSASRPTGQVATPVPMLHITLNRDNPDLAPALQYINHQRADIISFIEVTPESLPELQAGLPGYRLAAAEPRSNSHGSAWFVAIAPTQPITVTSHEVIHLPATSDRPLLKITLAISGRDVTLLCFHAIRPSNAEKVAYQRVEFAALADWSQQLAPTPVIVIGDFNDTPWSVPMRQMFDRSRLTLARSGFWVQPTWPSMLPSLFRIPIDHCLHSSGFKTIQKTVGPNVGSDHLPILVDLVPVSGN
jgi:endonuclease/exonuclease/phosphatase (EEP) superfamily protein YafD